LVHSTNDLKYLQKVHDAQYFRRVRQTNWLSLDKENFTKNEIQSNKWQNL